MRLIAATNANLEEDVKSGRFRSDLFYRLNVIPIQIPPLRERVDDIPLLVDYFVRQYCERGGEESKMLSPEAMRALNQYDWPGNVRELENCIERAVLLAKRTTIEAEDFPARVVETRTETIVSKDKPDTPTLESIEKAYIYFIMNQTNGQKAKAAKLLGIDSSTLYRKLKRYQLIDDEDES